MNQSPEEIVESDLRRLFRELSGTAHDPCDVNRVNKNYDDAKVEILTRKLGEFLSNNHERRVNLYLCNNAFGPEGCKSLVSVMTAFPDHIVKLDLSHTNLVNEGARILATALETNTSVKTLVLHHTGIDTGIESIGDMLKVNRHLETLDVENNHFLVINSDFTIPESLFRLADGYAHHPNLVLIFTRELQVRLEFLRLVIQVEVPGSDAVDELLRHQDDKNNGIIKYLVESWRRCKEAGEHCFPPTKALFEQIEAYKEAFSAKNEAKYLRIKAEAVDYIDTKAPRPGWNSGESTRAKIVLIGDKDSGKTSLLDSLGAARPVITRAGANTICANIKEVRIKGVDCAVYEVGGHKAFRGVPTLFMSPKSVAIVVVNLEMYNTDVDREYFRKVQKWLAIVKYHIDNANIFVVGTHEDRVKDKNELQRRVDHINGYLQKWISHSANLKVANANFFKEREDGVYRKGDIPQIDWIEEYIPLPRKKNIFLDAHHPKNIPCVSKSEDEAKFAGKTIATYAEKFPKLNFAGSGSSKSIFVTGSRDSFGIEQLHEKLGKLLRSNAKVHVKLTPKEDFLAARLAHIGRDPSNYVVAIKDLPNDRRRDKVVLADLLVESRRRNPIMAAMFAPANNNTDRVFESMEELRDALKKLHSIGHVLWYSECENLSNWVFLSPQWVADMIGSLIRYDAVDTLNEADSAKMKHEIARFRDEAVIPIQLLHRFEHWRDAGNIQRRTVTKLLNELDLLCWAPQRGMRDAYFVPFQLRNPDLKVSAKPYVLPSIPRQLSRLVPDPKFSRDKFERKYYEEDDSLLKKKHVQYQILCVNGFAEGVFCRFLARIQPYVELDFSTLSKMGVVARDPSGCKFLIEEHKFYYKGWNRKVLDSGGALLITGLEESRGKRSFWNTMVLLTDEVDRMVNDYSGILSGVFITYIDLDTKKLIISQRRKMEYLQKQALKNGVENTRQISVYVEGEGKDLQKIPLSRILPEVTKKADGELYSKPYSTRRNNFLGKSRAVVTNMDKWLEVNRDEEDESRMKIIHFELAQLLESFLQHTENGNEVGQSGFDVYCRNIREDPDIKEDDLADKISSVYEADVTGATRVTMESNERLLAICKKLLKAVEKKAIRKEFEPDQKTPGGFVNAA